MPLQRFYRSKEEKFDNVSPEELTHILIRIQPAQSQLRDNVSLDLFLSMIKFSFASLFIEKKP